MSGEFTATNATEPPSMSRAWDKWLHTATYEQLAAAEADRAQYAESDNALSATRLSERTAILAEMDRRDRAAKATKNAMFPRITFAELEDAELLGEIVKRAAIQTIEQLSELQSLRHAQIIGNRLGVNLEIIIHGASQGEDLDSIRKSHVTVLLRQAELLSVIGQQLAELRKTNGGGTHDDRERDLQVSEMAEVITTAIAKFAPQTGE